MSAILLIYETAVPLSANRHRGLSVEFSADYGFSAKVNSVPLMAVEFPHACSEYAIVFTGRGDAVLPAVILGIRDNENLYLTGQQSWDAKYIPAFIRRYPFVFSEAENGRLLLCMDEKFSGLNAEGRGQRLFKEDGKPSEYTQKVLDFLQNYQSRFERTQAFCRKLVELELLEPMQAQVDMTSGERLSLGGFMAVNRARLRALAPEALAALAKNDELELIYLHLQSMRNFAGLQTRLGVAEGAKAARAAEKTEAGSLAEAS